MIDPAPIPGDETGLDEAPGEFGADPGLQGRS